MTALMKMRGHKAEDQGKDRRGEARRWREGGEATKERMKGKADESRATEAPTLPGVSTSPSASFAFVLIYTASLCDSEDTSKVTRDRTMSSSGTPKLSVPAPLPFL